MKILERGSYSLYDLVLPGRAYFFIGYYDSTVSELIYRVKEKNDTLEEDQTYKKVIFNLFIKEGISDKYFNRINNALYNASDLGALFRILNQNRTGIRIKKKSSGNYQAEIFVGGIRNSFPTAFDGDFTTANQFKPYFSLSAGINLLYSIPGFFKSFKVGLSIGYNGYDSKLTKSGTNSFKGSANFYGTTTYIERMTLSNSFLVTNIYVMYLINPLSKLKLYLKGGLNYDFSVSKNSDLIGQSSGTTTGIMNGNVPFQTNSANDHSLITIKRDFLSFLVSVGLITGRHKLEFCYWPNTQLAAPTAYPLAPAVNSFKFGSTAFYYYFFLFPEKNGKRK